MLSKLKAVSAVPLDQLLFPFFDFFALNIVFLLKFSKHLSLDLFLLSLLSSEAPHIVDKLLSKPLNLTKKVHRLFQVKYVLWLGHLIAQPGCRLG